MDSPRFISFALLIDGQTADDFARAIDRKDGDYVHLYPHATGGLGIHDTVRETYDLFTGDPVAGLGDAAIVSSAGSFGAQQLAVLSGTTLLVLIPPRGTPMSAVEHLAALALKRLPRSNPGQT